MARRPVAVAVTGGIGAGKSAALAAFARCGAAVISSDEIVHRLLREDADVKAALRERWGERVFGDDGAPDRAAIGEIVFGSRDELAWLEALLHPRVAAEYLRWRDELATLAEPPRVCVTEVPLLYETGAETRFDAVVAITAPEELRRQRAGERLDARADRLVPDDEKVRRADYAYVNDGSLAELEDFVAGVYAELARNG